MNDSWGTPRALVAQLADAFGPFDLDAAAEPWSAVCKRFVTKRQNLFKHAPAAERVFLNPPYSRGNLVRFVSFAREQVLTGRWGSCTLLVPHYTSEGWWRHVVRPEGKARGAEWRRGRLRHPLEQWVRLISERLVVDIVSLSGRQEFLEPPKWRGKVDGARFASAVVVFSEPGGHT